MEQYLIDNTGLKIAYHKLNGTSPGIVFLGGFMSDMTGTKATHLEALCRKLGKSYVRFDYSGHGISSGEFEEGTIGRWLADVLLVLDQLTEGPQILVGSSMGGWLMLLATLRRPSRICGLVGIAPAPDFLEDFYRLNPEQQRLLDETGLCHIPSQQGDKPYPISSKLVEEGRQHRLLDREIAIDCPVRLLHGLNDTDVSWEKSLKLTERLTSQDVQVTLIKGGDHRLSNEAQLALLGETVQNLLEEVAQ